MILLKNFLITVVLISLTSCYNSSKDTLDVLYDRSVDIPYSKLVEIAYYIDRYPESRKLFEDILDKDWVISYKPNAMVTHSMYENFAMSFIIYFDPSVGALMGEGDGLGVASPTDALLHEMLHVRELTPDVLMRKNRSYPNKHELAVISLERKLYHSMDAEDGRKRPQRYTHAGKMFRATCVTCNY